MVAENNPHEIVGFAMGGLPREEVAGYNAEVWALYVLDEYQGKGIRRRLLTMMLNEFLRARHTKIVWVLEANEPARKFYKRMGGTLLSLKKPLLWQGEPVAMEVVYGWCSADFPGPIE